MPGGEDSSPGIPLVRFWPGESVLDKFFSR